MMQHAKTISFFMTISSSLQGYIYCTGAIDHGILFSNGDLPTIQMKRTGSEGFRAVSFVQ
jgi:hypothetical protein